MPETNKPHSPSDLRPMKLSAELKFSSQVDGAKSVPVTIVARSGDAINHPYWGSIVHDFAGMSVAAKIPLDYAHNPDVSIGFLDKFDATSGDLVCTGAIVLVDAREDGYGEDGAVALVAKMSAGIPYQASIEFDDEMTLEYVPQGMSVNVNGKDVPGPATIVRQWTLSAVAICKAGADCDTSAEVQFSKTKKDPQPSGAGFLVQFAKPQGATKMSKQETPATTPAATKLEATKTDPVAVPAKVVETPAVETPAAVVPAAVAAVIAAPVVALSKDTAADPRIEFKRYYDAFGDRAATYFASGLNFDQATVEEVKFQKSVNTALLTRLGAVERGAEQPVEFSKKEIRNEGKTGFSKVIRMPGKAK